MDYPYNFSSYDYRYLLPSAPTNYSVPNPGMSAQIVLFGSSTNGYLAPNGNMAALVSPYSISSMTNPPSIGNQAIDPRMISPIQGGFMLSDGVLGFDTVHNYNGNCNNFNNNNNDNNSNNNNNNNSSNTNSNIYNGNNVRKPTTGKTTKKFNHRSRKSNFNHQITTIDRYPSGERAHHLENAKGAPENDQTGGATLEDRKKNPFDPECSIPLPFQLGEDYGYVHGMTTIYKRNERERHRVRCVNDGYEKLRQHLPLSSAHKDKRLSKVETLRFAIRYIRHMELLLADEDHYITCKCKLTPKKSELTTMDGGKVEDFEGSMSDDSF